MKRIITLLFLLLPLYMAKAQVLSIDNGILFSNTKYKSQDVCNHESYAVFLSVDYMQIKKSFYLNSQIGYFNTGYYTYQYNYLGHIVGNQKLKSHDMHFSTTVRGKIPIHNFFIYAGLGPKVDFSLSNYAKIADHTFPNLNTFRNIFGAKFDFGVCMDVQQVRIGLNTAYITNLNNGDMNTNRFVCGLSVGYHFR